MSDYHIVQCTIAAAIPAIRSAAEHKSPTQEMKPLGESKITSVEGTDRSMRNLTFDEIQIGRPFTLSRTLSRPDIEALAFAAGTIDTFALDGNGHAGAESVQAVSAATLINHLVNRQFPGAGSVLIGQSFTFSGELKTGDTVVATLTPLAKDAARGAVTIECAVTDAAGSSVLAGQVIVLAPSVGAEQPEIAPTEVIFRRTDALGRLIRRAEQGAPVSTAIVHPCDRDSLLGAIEAARRGLIEPVLVGPEAKIRAAAADAEVDLAPYRIVGVEHSHAAAARAVAMAHNGEVAALMKGSLHTDELMAAVVARDGGLRTARRISHVYLMDVPSYPRLLLVTDAAVNVAPDVLTKADILQNAFDLAHAIGIDEPKAAVLAAVETVNPAMAATVDAAMLCKMVDRGQKG